MVISGLPPVPRARNQKSRGGPEAAPARQVRLFAAASAQLTATRLSVESVSFVLMVSAALPVKTVVTKNL